MYKITATVDPNDKGEYWVTFKSQKIQLDYPAFAFVCKTIKEGITFVDLSNVNSISSDIYPRYEYK